MRTAALRNGPTLATLLLLPSLAAGCESSGGGTASRSDAGHDSGADLDARSAESGADSASDASPGDGGSRDGGPRDGGPGEAGTADASEGGTPPRHIDQMDVLFVVDNSRSMGDAQAVLATGAAELVGRLVNPLCVDATGAPAGTQPAGPGEACSGASTREYPPISDLHLGVISTSIGGHGSDSCPASETYSCPGGVPNESNDDRGHLLTRRSPCADDVVSTYQSLGFLAWDPEAKLSPPGEASMTALQQSLTDLVNGVGQFGCGFESSLESWYRFLVDPEPYESIVVDGTGKAVPTGTDSTLLAERAAFLRPGSLLLVILLTDEDDCSIKESGQFYFAAQQRTPGDPLRELHLPRPRAECAANPADPCCRSCGQSPGACPADPSCTTPLSATEDPFSLRCFDQKRRFGIDFLYPIDRYTAGLTQSTVLNRAGGPVANPVFSSTGAGANARDPDMVYFASWVGVPWQDIARDPTDAAKGLKNHVELAATRTGGITTWDGILGDPASFVPPKDPHMIPSAAPRSGTDPLTGITLAPPTAPNGSDAINGHEYSIDNAGGAADDLQYATVFELPAARDCSLPGAICDCTYPLNDQPICEPNPSDSG
ncbi:MAG TPA: hypothetical protein VHE30_18690, partial [Polyangiaceae bacterium]|nr:hypothetical protein [Polyangiaceae bacterium]